MPEFYAECRKHYDIDFKIEVFAEEPAVIKQILTNSDSTVRCHGKDSRIVKIGD